MKKSKLMSVLFTLLIYTVFSLFSVSAFAIETDKDEELALSDAIEDTSAPALSEDVSVGSRIWELFFGGENKNEELSLLAGGDVFGIKIKQKNVTVTDAKGVPALKCGDVIISINGKKIESVLDAKEAISGCEGNSVTIKALHGAEPITIEVRPRLEGGEYKLGLSLRDGAVGIGTITYIDPKTGAFGGLGHGICDSETGEVVDMASGEVVGVILGGVHRGECGKPGELSGILTEKALGEIARNNECGVFGVLSEFDSAGELFEVGCRSDVHEGEATIISTIKNGKSAEYKIEIYDIDRNSDGSKSFRIRVTDKTLVALTGGIVRGMSGSPIIQDGKLVGAVTHVLVAKPTEGYGIFIENMLNASQGQVQPKAA